MDIKSLIKNYLGERKMMQIATMSDRQPWVCTVYFAEDNSLNLYWLSLPTRRHSIEIERNNKIAVAIPVKFDTNPVIGIQAQGTASIVKEPGVVAEVMRRYIEKTGSGKDFYELFKAGKNKHQLYKFMPEKYQLFDEVNFSEDPKKEWNP